MSDVLLHDPETHKTGKSDAKDPHAYLEDFIDFEKAQAVITVPANIINSSVTDGGPAEAITLAIYLNDEYGDCTCAGAGNKLRLDSNDEVQVTDQDVEVVYEAVTLQEGAEFNPGPPPVNDNGCAEIDVLDYLTAEGIGGYKILGHAAVHARNDSQRRMALYLCGALYSGEQLSTDQQTQQIWEPGPAAPGSWGGHCTVHADEYTELADLVIGGVPIPQDVPGGFAFAAATWGSYKPCAGAWIDFAYDELHALITQQWLNKVAESAVLSSIVNLSALQTYLATLTPEK